MGPTGHPRAAVVAADDAIRASLVLLLEMCGFPASGFAEPAELLTGSRDDERFIFADYTSDACSALRELRRRGWTGIAVLMDDGDVALHGQPPEGPVLILPKPFAADEVVSILAKQNN